MWILISHQCSVCCWTWKIVAPDVHDVVSALTKNWADHGTGINTINSSSVARESGSSVLRSLERLKIKTSDAAAKCHVYVMSGVFYSCYRALEKTEASKLSWVVFPVHEIGKSFHFTENFIYWQTFWTNFLCFKTTLGMGSLEFNQTALLSKMPFACFWKLIELFDYRDSTGTMWLLFLLSSQMF